jgi:CPA2 family monovalent cation:H+ antiporter-2
LAIVAGGFVFAAIFGYLADRLRLPPLVGYLVAGVMIGSSTPGFVADSALASQLAEIGVILLMFGVGLHFSAADLLAVGGVAIPGAILQIAVATLLGIGLTELWGWSIGAGLVFGLSLAVASTVVLLKALEERKLINASSGRVAVGWLIVEDLAMVLALVLLPAFAGVLGGHAEAEAGGNAAVVITIAITLLKVAAFAVLAIFLGPKVVPWILTRVARTGSRELFTLSVLAIALGIAFGAAEIFGVSFALGAFFAGVVMSESNLSHRAAADSLPLQNAFSVLFFVSVGMLFDPSILVREPLAVVGALALIILGKSISAFILVLLLRYPMGMGLIVGAGLAQIGEFSFILAGLGSSLGLLPQEGQDLILAAAILSITLNPLVFMAAEKLLPVMPALLPFVPSGYGKRKRDILSRELERIRAASAGDGASGRDVPDVCWRRRAFAGGASAAVSPEIGRSRRPGDQGRRSRRWHVFHLFRCGAGSAGGRRNRAWRRLVLRRDGPAQRCAANSGCRGRGFLPVPCSGAPRFQYVHVPPSATARRRQHHGRAAQGEERVATAAEPILGSEVIRTVYVSSKGVLAYLAS